MAVHVFENHLMFPICLEFSRIGSALRGFVMRPCSSNGTVGTGTGMAAPVGMPSASECDDADSVANASDLHMMISAAAKAEYDREMREFWEDKSEKSDDERLPGG